MNHRVQAYIDRINADDPTLREINLASLNLGDTYITELMAALTSNPNVAQRIVTLNLADNKLTSINIPETLVALQKLNLSDNQSTSINIPATLVALQKLSLYGNQLTSINIPEALMALRWLNIEDNPLLTVATKIALETLRRTLVNNNFLMFYENPVSAATQLTDDILNAHFKLMLRSHPEQIIAHLKKTSAVWLLSYLPYELAGKIGEYVEPITGVGVERALASMTNFQGIFSRLLRLNVDNNEQLNTLNLNTLNFYNKTVLQELIIKTKNYYAKVFEGKTVVTLGLVNEFLRKNGFDSTDLSKKNAQGFTPLALAKANITSHPGPNAKAIIPFIQRRTSYKEIMYLYLATASKSAYNHKELIATSAAMAAVAACNYLATNN